MLRSIETWIASAMLVSCIGVLHAATEQNAKVSVFDPQQLPTVHGVVAHYTLLPRGAVDGFILEDSTQVLAVPLFSNELLSTIHPGDAVTIYGLRATGMPLVLAMALINDQSKQSVLLGEIPMLLAMGRAPAHHAPPAHPAAPSAEASPSPVSREAQIHGTVKQPIFGPLGSVSGALLLDGLLVRMASTEGARVAPFLKVGESVWVKGQLSDSPLGKLMIVEAIGASADNLTLLAPWDGPQ